MAGVETPNLFYALLMAAAGFGWGCYSILGKKSNSPTLETANHFIKASIICLIAVLIYQHSFEITSQGLTLAILSGAIASGVGSCCQTLMVIYTKPRRVASRISSTRFDTCNF